MIFHLRTRMPDGVKIPDQIGILFMIQFIHSLSANSS